MQLGIYVQQAIYQGFSCNIPYITLPVWQKIEDKYDGLAGVVEAINGKKDERDSLNKFL